MGTVGDAALIASMAGSPVASTTSGRAANASRATSGICRGQPKMCCDGEVAILDETVLGKYRHHNAAERVDR